MYRYKRVFLIVMDSLGIGAMPDSDKFGDFGVDTLGHIAEKMDSFTIPNLRRLGMANLKAMDKVDPVESPLAYYAPLREKSNGKDTMTGHWEMMGLEVTKPFQTFTETGFPPELIKELEERTGLHVVLWDERRTTVAAHEILHRSGKKEKKHRQSVDAVAATLILQGYLDFKRRQ